MFVAVSLKDTECVYTFLTNPFWTHDKTRILSVLTDVFEISRSCYCVKGSAHVCCARQTLEGGTQAQHAALLELPAVL